MASTRTRSRYRWTSIDGRGRSVDLELELVQLDGNELCRARRPSEVQPGLAVFPFWFSLQQRSVDSCPCHSHKLCLIRVFFSPIILPGPCQSRKVDAQSWWGPTRKMRSTKCFSAPWFLTSRRPFLVRNEDVSIRLVGTVLTLNGHDPAGARWYIRWQKELMLAADVAYFGLTTFCGECAAVMHVMPHPNTYKTRCVVVKNRGWDVVKRTDPIKRTEGRASWQVKDI